MAEQTISVTDLASQGVVIDTPPVALAPNVFTNVRNVRFKDGAVRKITGELLLNNIVEDLVPANELSILNVGVYKLNLLNHQ